MRCGVGRALPLFVHVGCGGSDQARRADHQEADFGRKTEKGLDVRGRGPAFSGLGANGAWATCELDICFSGGPSFNISPKSSGKLLLRKHQKSHSKYVCVDSTCQPL